MVGVLLGRVGGRVSGTGGERAIASKNAAARLRLPLAFAGWSPWSLCVSVFVLFAWSNAVNDSVLVGGGCFAHVDCAQRRTSLERQVAGSGSAHSQDFRLSALDLYHQFVGHLPVFFQGMERSERNGGDSRWDSIMGT